METCEVCKTEYLNCFKVIVKEKTHIFDSFECAIHALAPRCNHCECRIIGHGVEHDKALYCCKSCARQGAHLNLRIRNIPLRLA